MKQRPDVYTHEREDVHMAWSGSIYEHLMNKCRADNSLHNELNKMCYTITVVSLTTSDTMEYVMVSFSQWRDMQGSPIRRLLGSKLPMSKVKL